VIRERRNGLSLEVAVERVRTAGSPAEPSIFAAIRRAARDLPVQVMGTGSMLAISRAIEDECYAHGDRHVIFGAFQHERFFRRAAHRWRELGRTGEYSVVFADFAESLPDKSPAELRLGPASVLMREWAVVCDSPTFTACVAGWERPDGGQAAGRRFEAIWTVEPKIVRHVSRACVRLVEGAAPDLAAAIGGRLEAQPIRGSDDLRNATIVTNRVVGYLDHLAR
jgi:MerR family transcriptional regulator, light-induced transcriptional regulator